MSDSFKCFPSTEMEAIAFLYVQNQDLTNKSAAEIHVMYREALKEIKSASAARRTSQR